MESCSTKEMENRGEGNDLLLPQAALRVRQRWPTEQSPFPSPGRSCWGSASAKGHASRPPSQLAGSAWPAGGWAPLRACRGHELLSLFFCVHLQGHKLMMEENTLWEDLGHKEFGSWEVTSKPLEFAKRWEPLLFMTDPEFTLLRWLRGLLLPEIPALWLEGLGFEPGDSSLISREGMGAG